MLVREIAGYMRKAQAITIVLGAGASRSANIPTAPELVRIIQSDYPHCLRSLSEQERKDYGRVMGALSPADRKSLIEPLLANAKLNWGHLALACIIGQGNISRILSFNFDFLVERATALLGRHLPVYDFGVAPSPDLGGLATPALFHLHGQSYGLRLMNSTEETTAHRTSIGPLLADSLRNHLTIVCGYSGEADASFDTMVEAYNSNHNLIWLGHAKEPAGHLAPLLAKPYATYAGGYDFDRVMLDLAKELGCWPPPLFDNPPAHVAETLKTLTPFPVTEDLGYDLLRLTLERLDVASTDWRASKTPADRSAEALLAGTEQPPVGEASNMSEAERETRAWAAIRAGIALAGEARTLIGAERAAKFREAGEKFAQALTFKADMHEAFYNWGVALAGEARALDVAARAAKLRDACEKYAQALALNPDDHGALNNWGVALTDKARILEGGARTTKLREASEKYAKALAIKPDKHGALYNWGNVLLTEASMLAGAARAAKLEQAEGLLLQARKLSGKASYNLACLHALRGETEKALDELEACRADGTLPKPAHLASDSDMDSLRAEPRFQSLLG